MSRWAEDLKGALSPFTTPTVGGHTRLNGDERRQKANLSDVKSSALRSRFTLDHHQCSPS
jgi:hypothetical protein